jgi:predicted amidohydrolase
MIRVAAVQLAVTDDVNANLDTCLRLIDEAASHHPELIVLPEFCNHLAWYADREHSYEVAVDLNGTFLGAIGERANQHQCYIMINVTLRREPLQVTGSNVLFDPAGTIVAVSDKQVLMGNENNFLEKATEPCEIIALPWGNAGMYSCMDGVIFETSRGMAVRGADILLNSLNSFAKDEGNLHIPVRAAENKVFVVAANKVGALVPAHLLDAVAARLKIAPTQLFGGGHSQIVAPDGTVLAKADHGEEAVIFADIDLAQATNKTRPDGTDIMSARRPDLYKAFASPPQTRQKGMGANQVTVATFQPKMDGRKAVAEVASILPEVAEAGVKLLVLPELFYLQGGVVDNVMVAQQRSQEMVAVLTKALADFPDLHVATSVVDVGFVGNSHVGVLLGNAGILLHQPQLHASNRHPWVTTLGRNVHTLDMAWGRLAVVVGNDAIYPETFRLAVLQDCEVVAVSTHILEAWEWELGLLERAAENRLNLVVGSRPTLHGGSGIIAADEDFTLWAEWKKRPFDGNINYPIVTRTTDRLTYGTVYPAASANRTISQNTNVVENRPWWLAETLL